MTRKPPKEAGPIRHDTTQGDLQVVISFRQPSKDATAPDWQEWWTWRIRHINHAVADLDIAVRQVGAQGEASEVEEWPPGSGNLTGDVPRHHTTRDKTDIEPRDGLL